MVSYEPSLIQAYFTIRNRNSTETETVHKKGAYYNQTTIFYKQKQYIKMVMRLENLPPIDSTRLPCNLAELFSNLDMRLAHDFLLVYQSS